MDYDSNYTTSGKGKAIETVGKKKKKLPGFGLGEGRKDEQMENRGC